MYDNNIPLHSHVEITTREGNVKIRAVEEWETGFDEECVRIYIYSGSILVMIDTSEIVAQVTPTEESNSFLQLRCDVIISDPRVQILEDTHECVRYVTPPKNIWFACGYAHICLMAENGAFVVTSDYWGRWWSRIRISRAQ